MPTAGATEAIMAIPIIAEASLTGETEKAVNMDARSTNRHKYCGLGIGFLRRPYVCEDDDQHITL